MNALIIIAQKEYQDLEYQTTKNLLEKAGITTITCSKNIGPCQGSSGTKTQATIVLEDVDVQDYDAIIFIGGSGSSQYFTDAQAHLTAQETISWNKPLAAICLAPRILAHAGVLAGKKATVWDGDKKQSAIFQQEKVIFTAEPLTIDGNIITANGPQAAPLFAQAIIAMLKSSKKKL